MDSENNNNIYSEKSKNWLKKSIKQNWKMLKSIDLFYMADEKKKEMQKTAYEIFNETLLMKQDLSMRKGLI